MVTCTGQWWLLAVGAACVLAAWHYTGGRRPYGYRGLGEVFVFVFFGLVATIGTVYVQAGWIPWPGWPAAVASRRKQPFVICKICMPYTTIGIW